MQPYFDGEVDTDDIEGGFVRKPIYSREGANVSIVKDGEVLSVGEGEYGDEGYIVQAFMPLPKFEDNYAVIGSWVVGDEAVGISLREDDSLVTKDLSRFIPHVILD